MRKFASLILGLSLLLSFSNAKADEGMWLLSLLNKNVAEMKAKGLKLSADDIYSINKSCLKDAIVGLGFEGRPFRHFCTGEIISDQGLFLTNHHCGFSALQSHSTTEHDYLSDGFWAYNKNEELTNPGVTASILVRMEDVSKEVLSAVNDEMTEEERYKAIEKVAVELEKKAEEGTDYKANVKSMFEGNQYFLFVYVIYKDVRLVGAPPQSMGKFGGDTDNWMWPRHTADFSMFRIYTGPDGKPADYSDNNIPLKPNHHLPVSAKGVEEQDFAMIMGFPGTTDRYLTSFGLEETMKITNQNRYDIRTLKLDIMKEDMLKDAKVRIQYAAKHAQSANYWKYSNEQNKALTKLNTMGHKKEIEKEYLEWANKKSKREAKYGKALEMIAQVYAERKEVMNASSYLREALLSGAEMPVFAIQLGGLKSLLEAETPDTTAIEKAITGYRQAAEGFYKDYNAPTDEKLMAGMYKMYAENIPADQQPEIFKTFSEEYNNDFNKLASDVYSNSIFATSESFNKFLDDPKLETLENDIAFKIGNSIIAKYKEIRAELSKGSDQLQKGKRLFVDGLMQINKKKNLAPDANSSIRLTYGNVGGYTPKDGVYYKHFTTLKGVMEKEDPTNDEFVVPAKLKELYNKKDFGQYADKNGNLPVCFLTNSDITGGNSGSPVINGNGELIGTAFDGNSEAMSGDIDFEENLQRCINLDIRYTLFIIDKFAGAQNLIDEMTIVK
ncbi:S46 family peptidase [Labilibaculum euxinus]|uniref:Dipeptidyl-peptidase n=1 Tax=Labilibaculum euxinus TaxID=2686357 RepID=A0A7M4D4R4_9BACT|nr:S46 family peptidase [Labilibaculum euxinus]MUP37643.1 serine protease [Labilibaculum euxinus]MVB06848.1 serine protease [Labilibaculum euxinus]